MIVQSYIDNKSRLDGLTSLENSLISFEMNQNEVGTDSETVVITVQ